MVITAKSIVKREIFDVKTLAEDLAQSGLYRKSQCGQG